MSNRVWVLLVVLPIMGGCSTWGSASAGGSAGIQRPAPQMREPGSKPAFGIGERQEVAGRQCNITTILLESMDKKQRCNTYKKLGRAERSVVFESLTADDMIKYFGGCE